MFFMDWGNRELVSINSIVLARFFHPLYDVFPTTVCNVHKSLTFDLTFINLTFFLQVIKCRLSKLKPNGDPKSNTTGQSQSQDDLSGMSLLDWEDTVWNFFEGHDTHWIQVS